MADYMNGYELLRDFSSENAGFCRWTFAKKGGNEYFLKEFVDPVYPMDTGELSERIISDRKTICKNFENTKLHLYEEVNNISDGNLIRIQEFFRYDSRYYIAMPKVPDQHISIQDIASSPMATRIQLCRTLAYSLMQLHERGIVHADIKPSNVIIKKTRTGRFTGQIIDFDCSFFQMNPPKDPESLHGDQVYLSPEALRFICEEHVLLTCQMDVFALGIMFHEYLTGEVPRFNQEEYDYPCEALLMEDELILSPKLDAVPEIRQVIEWMLEVEPSRRIPIANVFEQLGGDLDYGYSVSEEESVDTGWVGSDSRFEREGTASTGFRSAGADDLM